MDEHYERHKADHPSFFRRLNSAQANTAKWPEKFLTGVQSSLRVLKHRANVLAAARRSTCQAVASEKTRQASVPRPTTKVDVWMFSQQMLHFGESKRNRGVRGAQVISINSPGCIPQSPGTSSRRGLKPPLAQSAHRHLGGIRLQWMSEAGSYVEVCSAERRLFVAINRATVCQLNGVEAITPSPLACAPVAMHHLIPVRDICVTG